MTTVLLFIAVLFVLITVHELGHFWAARLSNVKVTEFGIGLPPKAWGYKPARSEVEYTLNWLPIGGFVKIFGEDYEALSSADPDYARSFIKASKIRQIFILVGGVLMNFLIAIILFAGAAWLGVLSPTDNIAERSGFYVVAVSPGSPADAAGLLGGEEVLSITNGEITLTDFEITGESFAETISQADGPVLIEKLSLDGEVEKVEITPAPNLIAEEPDRLAIGVYADSLVKQRAGFFEGVAAGWEQSVSGLKAVTVGFYGLISEVFKGNGGSSFSSLSGPIGIAQLSNQALQIGFASLLSFAAFLSLNLVVLNLLPFPALDGGRIVMVVAEAIKGSPLPSKFAGWLNMIGFGLLLLLMLAVTIQDITRLF